MIESTHGADRVVERGDPFWTTRFFPDAELNVAEMLLREPTADEPMARRARTTLEAARE